jgi:hypothetical protein
VNKVNWQRPLWNGNQKVVKSSGRDVIFVCLFVFKFLLFCYSYVHTMLLSFLPPALNPSFTTHSSPSLSPHTPSIPGRNYFALVSNFVEERI